MAFKDPLNKSLQRLVQVGARRASRIFPGFTAEKMVVHPCTTREALLTQSFPARLSTLLSEVRACTLCAHELPLGPRPVVQAGRHARILVVGQAPGTKVHATGIPFNDPSGDRLRAWMGIDRDTFYDADQIALLPMAFCYPGRGKSGDLPPPPRCAQTWRTKLMRELPNIELTIVLGQYAQTWHLPAIELAAGGKTLTDTVLAWRQYIPKQVPMPHPSPRNNLWLRRNPWLEIDVIPWLQQRVKKLLASG